MGFSIHKEAAQMRENHPCVPDSLPVVNLDYSTLTKPLREAYGEVCRYDGRLRGLPNPSILLSPLTAKEAVVSSQIEGTQATLEEVLAQDAGVEFDERATHEIQEVLNYRAVIRQVEGALADRPITLSLIRQMHGLLLSGVRGQHKEPGSFRKDQNWIGKTGSSKETARFIPPDPLQLPAHLENWELYINESDADPILQAAVGHAQFEILHPFKDGNGRIGRVLIPLLMFHRGLLFRPMFYLSEYLEANRLAYYDHLLTITNEGKWEPWIGFFANAVKQQAKANALRIDEMFRFYTEAKKLITAETRSRHAFLALDAFFSQPIQNATMLAQSLDLNNRKTLQSTLLSLVSTGLVKKIKDAQGQSPAVYAMPALLEIVDRPIFARNP